MAALPSSAIARWAFAIKPASFPKLMVPMLLGQAIGVAATGSISPAAVAFGVVFTVLDGIFIVFLNDWADRDIDALKRRLLPHAGSPKTIPDRILPATHLLIAGAAAGAGAVLASFATAQWLERPLLGWAGLVCLGVFAAYSLPPLRLNYRGGGELLEALGVGLLLPWVNAYAQSCRVAGPELWLLPGYALLSLGSAVASGLSDEVSDRAGGKRTLVALLGNAAGRRVTEAAMLAGAGAWLVSVWLVPALATRVALVFAALSVFHAWRRVRRASPLVTTYAFAEQAAYKAALHRAIWGAGVALGAVELLYGLARGT